MEDASLTWSQAWILAAALIVGGLLLAAKGRGFWRKAGPVLREAGIVAALYGCWQFAGDMSHHDVAGAFDRGKWIASAEHWLRLPAEADLQHPLLAHPDLAWIADEFYARAHLTGMGIMLVWLFWRHRDKYPPVRNVVAAFTLLATAIQLIPVAPPRLLPQLGNIDIAAHYGQSVYVGTGFAANELLAMPSIHVGWAVIVAGAAVWAGRGWGRHLAIAYPVAMTYAVVATGNHWWFDGLAAIVIIALGVAGQAGVTRLLRRRGRMAPDAPAAVGSSVVSA